MTQIFFDRSSVDTIGTLVSRFGRGAFASPFRSTVPLVALLKDEPDRFNDIAIACGCSSPSAVHLEYKVVPPGIDANASQTDAMIFSADAALAIEAKWTEPRYETVAKRLTTRVRALSKKHPTITVEEHGASQLAVISAWLGLLGRYADHQLDFKGSSGAIYQMIHRAASVCAAPQGRSTLAYLHFSPSPVAGAASAHQYCSDLAHLHQIMGCPAAFSFYFVEVPLRQTAAFNEIASLPKGKTQTDEAVRAALIRERLFTFQRPTIHRLG